MATNYTTNKRINSVSIGGVEHPIAPFHGTTAEWGNESYTPQAGEIVIYDTSDVSKIKIGDGERPLKDLDFIDRDLEQKIYKQTEEPTDVSEGTLWIDLDAENGGSGSNYAPAYTFGTEELEPGVSTLATGVLYFCYE